MNSCEHALALGQDAGPEQARRIIRQRARIAPGAGREYLVAGWAHRHPTAAFWRSAWVRFLRVERPRVRRVRQTVAQHVADVIEDDSRRAVAFGRRQRPDLLAVQRETLCRPQENCPTDSGGVEAFADDLAGLVSTRMLAGAELVHQVVPLLRRHGAVDRCGGYACIAEPLCDVLGVRDSDAERDRGSAGQVLQVVLDDIAGDAVLIERILQIAGIVVAADGCARCDRSMPMLGAR